jgi:uncharacterized membrane protein YeaQ/YmgE (transglycosylase-associated protein family)
MGIIVFIVIGILAGFISSKLIVGHDYGMFGDMLIGIIGAFIGGACSDLLVGNSYGLFATLGISTAGAVVFLVLARFLGYKFRSRRV